VLDGFGLIKKVFPETVFFLKTTVSCKDAIRDIIATMVNDLWSIPGICAATVFFLKAVVFDHAI